MKYQFNQNIFVDLELIIILSPNKKWSSNTFKTYKQNNLSTLKLVLKWEFINLRQKQKMYL